MFKTLSPNHVCADGLRVSVQASECHYSLPRGEKGPYSHVELGYPSEIPPEDILEYAEDREDPFGTVYPYVPIELVYKWLQAHGGALAL